MTRWSGARGVAACALALMLAADPAAAQFALPTDFIDELVVGGLSEPVGMAFLPGGRLLVVERATARVRLLVNGALAAVDPVVTVADMDAAYGEAGLLGVAADPGWPERPYVYLQYTMATHSRIARFTAAGDLGHSGDGALTLDPASRFDVIDPPRPASFHNGGTLRFGPDGMLYSSIGDPTACNSQLPGEMLGKILRLDVSGLPDGPGGPASIALITPADNPFALSPDPDARVVWHYGLRNPFRFGFDSETGDMLIGDVGGAEREELNYVAIAARNFEWPIYEGEVPGPYVCQFFDSTAFTGPIVTWDHGEGAAAMGGVVYRRSASAAYPFPPEYEGDIFYADFYGTWLRRLERNGDVWTPAPAPGQPNATDWGEGMTWISDWLQGPDGSLWYCRLATTSYDPGEIRRIRYAGTVAVPGQAAGAAGFRAVFPTPDDLRDRSCGGSRALADGPRRRRQARAHHRRRGEAGRRRAAPGVGRPRRRRRPCRAGRLPRPSEGGRLAHDPPARAPRLTRPRCVARAGGAVAGGPDATNRRPAVYHHPPRAVRR